MKKWFLVIIISCLIIQQGFASDTIQYNYSITKNDSSPNYTFRVYFTTNETIISVNMTVNGTLFILQYNSVDNNYYTTVPNNLAYQYVELDILTTNGMQTFSFPVDKIVNQKQNFDIFISISFFIILLFLVSKYVLFYEKY